MNTMTTIFTGCAALAMLSACQNADQDAASYGAQTDESNGNRLADKQVDDFNGEGLETVGNRGPDPDLKLEPATRYNTYFLDDYAEKGECDAPEKVLTLQNARTSFAGTTCEIDAISGVDDIVTLKLNACMSGEKAAADREYKLNLVAMDNLKMSTGDKAYTLARCESGI